MNKHLYTFNEFDKQIQDGFNRFKETYSILGDSVHQAYVQGFLDGIRSNLNDLVEAYKRDITQEKDKEK